MNTKIDTLATQIYKHRDLYYNAQPEISDAEFDILIDELKKLYPDHPAIMMVGAPVKNSEWKKAGHNIPMTSLDKASNIEEITAWITKRFQANNSIFITDKLDGLAIEVIYENGKLTQAISRGNGSIGELITNNVVKMGGVKKVLPISFTGSIRGEIILTKSKHRKYFPDKANPRNAASGIAKRLDGVGCEHLNVMVYQAIGNWKFDSEVFQFQFLEDELGLNVPNYEGFTSKTVKELVDFVVNRWEEYQAGVRDELDMDIDGLVCRINDLKIQDALIEDPTKNPPGAIAFKFRAESALTTVKDIILQTGNSGRITPVAIVNSVNLIGANIERASLYNFSYINELGVDIGADVIVCRRGDIIPRVEKVVNNTGSIFSLPTECPSCGGTVEMNGENLVCISTDICPAQISGRIANWVNGLNILELGDTLITRLVDTGTINNISDLYKLSIDDLAGLDRMGEKSATNVYNSIWSHNPIPLDQFLGSLSIPLVGASTIKMLMENGLDTLDKILAATQNQFVAIKGLGPAKSKSLFTGLIRNKHIIEEIIKMGIEIKTQVEGKLTGMKICITGKTNNKRADLAKMIEDNGGIFAKSVGKDTTHLVLAAEDSTSIKAMKAQSLGTKLINEEQLLGMME